MKFYHGFTPVTTIMNKHPAQDGSSLPTGLSSGWPHVAQELKFKIPLPRGFVPRPIEYTCQVSEP